MLSIADPPGFTNPQARLGRYRVQAGFDRRTEHNHNRSIARFHQPD